MSERIFRDRTEAGKLLVRHLPGVPPDALVIGLPRGGVPVAAEVARMLRLDLDVVVARKVGVPGQPELAMGAVCEGGIRVTNDQIVHESGVTDEQLALAEHEQQRVVAQRAATYRGGRTPPDVSGRVVVIVDDGLATGATARAACLFARTHGARRIVLAVPVAPRGWEADLGAYADDCVAVSTPSPFGSVGSWYGDFPEVTDDEVEAIMSGSGTRVIRSSFIVRTGAADAIDVDVTVPRSPVGCVVFVHGSGSGRMSPRNRLVADSLQQEGFATVLFDLLAAVEAGPDGNGPDLDLLAGRVLSVVDWVARQEWSRGLPVSVFGSSTGAAVALRAVVKRPEAIGAVVSRGGRVDLTGDDLAHVACPVLMLVGSEDREVLRLNQEAGRRLTCPHALVVVPGAGHLFEEPGALELVARRAGEWLTGISTRLDVPSGR